MSLRRSSVEPSGYNVPLLLLKVDCQSFFDPGSREVNVLLLKTVVKTGSLPVLNL